MNFYEEELKQVLNLEILAGNVLVGANCIEKFTKLSSLCPFIGSQIDWSAFPEAIESHESRSDFQVGAFSDFFCKIIARHNLGGDLIYMGDGVTDFTLEAEKTIFLKYLNDIFSIPQHHYFLAKDFSWCMVFSFEGDMSFAFIKVNS